MIEKLDYFFKKKKLYDAKYVYIYSDFRIFFKNYKYEPLKSVEKFLKLFTNKGITCIVPSFSYTTSGIFELKKTKSKVGFLSNYIIKNLKHERSEHPLFSFVAIGKNKKIVKNIGKSAFGKKSVHYKLYKKNTYFLNLFRPLKEGNTLVHHIEQMNNVKYRYDKSFKTKVLIGRNKVLNNYKAFLRKSVDNKNYAFTFRKIIKDLMKKKFMNHIVYKKSNINIYSYDNFYEYLNFLIKKDKNIFVKKK